MSRFQARDHILERNAITEKFRHPILSRRESFLLVASLGQPDLAQRPLAITSAFIVNFDSNIIGGTHLASPRVESASRLARAHDQLVAPMHRFMVRDHPAAEVSRNEMGKVIKIARWAGEHAVAAHALYPSRGKHQELASAVFVSRTIASSGNAVGTLPDFDDATGGEYDIDLQSLILAEEQGERTNLQTVNSIEARALGAVGLLVDQATLQASMDGVTED